MTGNTSNGNDSKKQGMVWHYILTYPVLITFVAVFSVFSVKSVYGVAINGAYAFLNGCGLEESIETGVGMAHYHYGDNAVFEAVDIFARIFSASIAVLGAVTVVLLSKRKEAAIAFVTAFAVLSSVFNTGYAVYRFVDLGVAEFINTKATFFAARFAVNFQFTVYAIISLVLLAVNTVYYKKRRYLFS